MNISPINSYNQVAFQAKKPTKKAGRFEKQNNQDDLATIKKRAVIAIPAATATLLATFALANCNSTQNNKDMIETQPSTSYIETVETEPTQETIIETTAPKTQLPIITTTIETIPQSERKAVWYEVQKGDRLADIVKEYADLDPLTPDTELVQYYEILEQDNPGKWSDRNKILIGTRFRVDSILPENISYSFKNNTIETQPIEETIAEEIEPTETQVTSEDDTVTINGVEFKFDLGTMDKTLLGDYDGLMFGKYTTLDKKMNGNVELTKFEGTNSKSNKSQTLIYNKEGEITEIIDFKDDKEYKISTYSYENNSTLEKVSDKTAKSSEIDEIETSYDRNSDSVNYRKFYVNNKATAEFDFTSGLVQIGENNWILDEGTFVCNDDLIGSKKYSATIDGKEVRFDVLKTGYCVEYIGNNGEIKSREQFDTKGNLISIE